MEEVWSTVQNTGAKNNTMDTKMSTSPDFPKAVFALRGTADCRSVYIYFIWRL